MAHGEPQVVLDEWARPASRDTLGYPAAPGRVSVAGGLVISDFAMGIVTLNEVRAYLGLPPVPHGDVLYAEYVQDQRRKAFLI
jgi:hypothetical protein